jgi:hypothetical protein
MRERALNSRAAREHERQPAGGTRAKALLSAAMRAAMAEDIKKEAEQIIRELLPDIDDRSRPSTSQRANAVKG